MIGIENLRTRVRSLFVPLWSTAGRIFPPRSFLYAISIALVLAIGLPIRDNPALDQLLPGLTSGLLWLFWNGPTFLVWGPAFGGLIAGTLLVLAIRVIARGVTAIAPCLRRPAHGSPRGERLRPESEAASSDPANADGHSAADLEPPPPTRRPSIWLGVAISAAWLLLTLHSMRDALSVMAFSMVGACLFLDVARPLRQHRAIPLLERDPFHRDWLAALWWVPLVFFCWHGGFTVLLSGLSIGPERVTTAAAVGVPLFVVLELLVQRRVHDRFWSRTFAIGAATMVMFASLALRPSAISGGSWAVWLSCALGYGFGLRPGRGTSDLRALALLAPIASLTVCLQFLSERGQPPQLERVHKLVDVTAVYDLRFDAPSGRLYFSSRGNEASLGWIDVKSGETRTVPGHMLQNPQRLALSRERHEVFVGGPPGVFRFDMDTLEAREPIELRSDVDLEVVNHRFLAIVSEQARHLRTVDLETGERREIRLPGLVRWPYSVDWSPELDRLYVADWMASPWVSSLRVDGTPIARRWVGFMNAGTCLLPDRRELLVARMFSRRVEVLDAETLETRDAIPVGFGVREIDCDSERGWLVALDHFRGVLSVLDVPSHRVLASTRIGAGARAVEYDAGSQTVYAGSSRGVFAWPLTESLKRSSQGPTAERLEEERDAESTAPPRSTEIAAHSTRVAHSPASGSPAPP